MLHSRFPDDTSYVFKFTNKCSTLENNWSLDRYMWSIKLINNEFRASLISKNILTSVKITEIRQSSFKSQQFRINLRGWFQSLSTIACEWNHKMTTQHYVVSMKHGWSFTARYLKRINHMMQWSSGQTADDHSFLPSGITMFSNE